jgi:tRNA-2-methylthio-N6-dimethylallyladenosine synthase
MEEADLVILNTCHIREKAAEKVYSELGRVRELKQEREIQGHDQRSSSPAASPRPRARRSCAARRPSIVVVGPQNYHNLPSF